MNATENHVNNAMAVDSHMRAVFTHSRNLDLPHVTWSRSDINIEHFRLLYSKHHERGNKWDVIRCDNNCFHLMYWIPPRPPPKMVPIGDNVKWMNFNPSPLHLFTNVTRKVLRNNCGNTNCQLSKIQWIFHFITIQCKVSINRWSVSLLPPTPPSYCISSVFMSQQSKHFLAWHSAVCVCVYVWDFNPKTGSGSIYSLKTLICPHLTRLDWILLIEAQNVVAITD